MGKKPQSESEAPKKEWKPYFERLRDPRWQKVKAEILKRDDFKCRECHCADKLLSVHHRWYERGKEPWDYDPSVFMTLCESCHEAWHERFLRFQKLFGFRSHENNSKIALLEAYHPSIERPYRISDVVTDLAHLIQGLDLYLVEIDAAKVRPGRSEWWEHLRDTLRTGAHDIVENLIITVRQKLEDGDALRRKIESGEP